jgi:hypothetical protein
VVTVGVVTDYTHTTVHLNDLLPMRHFARAVVLHSLEFVGVTILPLQFVTPVLVEVPDFLNS